MERQFAREFLADLIREPRALREALQADRARWLRGLTMNGREDLLFELDMLLRAVQLGLGRRHGGPSGKGALGQDFAHELRAVREAFQRASALSRKLLIPSAEQNFRFRAYLERSISEESGRPRLTHELAEQRTPDEGLFVLRHQLRALQGTADLLLKQDHVAFRGFDDFAVLAEYTLSTSKFFRPPGALDFRTEYDRVGSVQLLELVRKLGDLRARRALALGFLACFRLLRYLRFVQASAAVMPRRSVLVLALVRDEMVHVASYLTTDLKRMTASAPEAKEIALAADEASKLLKAAVGRLPENLNEVNLARAALNAGRETLSEAAKAAASALALAIEPLSQTSELFDGERSRRDRAERLRKDLYIGSQLLKSALDSLFPAMKGEPTRAFARLAALQRFTRDFKQVGYYLLRAGDHDPFDRFFTSLEALMNTSPSPARDRHLYLECRRFLTIAERGFALVNRRAELLDAPFDAAHYEEELKRYRSSAGLLDPSADEELASEVLGAALEEVATAGLHEATTLPPEEPIDAQREMTDPMLEMLGAPTEDGSVEISFEEVEVSPAPSARPPPHPLDADDIEDEDPPFEEATHRILRG
jgi:hypothetical protein